MSDDLPDLPDILNCPCCGGPPQYAQGINGLRIQVYVYCCHCPMRTEIVGSHEAAAAVWNKRPAAKVEVTILTPQPPPTNEAGDLWADIIAREDDPTLRALFVARREQGIAKYGRPLEVGNGRDFRADAIQEALDGLVYAEGLGDSAPAIWVRTCFRMALRTLVLEVPPTHALPEWRTGVPLDFGPPTREPGDGGKAWVDAWIGHDREQVRLFGAKEGE